MAEGSKPQSCNWIISEDAVVLIRKNKVYKPARLKKGRRVTVEKLSFLPDGALGHPYGSCFEVHGHQLVITGTKREEAEPSSGADNRAIIDDGSSQGLTHKDITEMKEQGACGKDIVESVIEHSASFKEKTKFSQEKYIKKKEKRHIPVLTILKPSTRALCEMYYARGPSKICHLRIDTVAQILTLGNIHANSDVVVMETCQGLLLGAILERMGGYGRLVQVFFGDFPVRFALNHFGHLSEEDQSVLMEYPLHRIGTLLDSRVPTQSRILQDISEMGVEGPRTEPRGDTATEGTDSDTSMQCEESGSTELKRMDTPEAQCRPISMDVEPGTKFLESDSAQATPESDQDPQDSLPSDNTCPPKTQKAEKGKEAGGGVGEEQKAEEGAVARRQAKRKWEDESLYSQEREEKKREKEERFKQAEELLKERQMDGLVIASRFHPEPLLTALIEFVAPSRPIVVYCHLLEPLVQCYSTLKQAGVAFNLQISETWLRHYQVLPERTHPEMTMDARSGYLLSGTTVTRTRN